MERDVELSRRGVESQPSAERLALEPRLPVRDGRGNGAVGVERAIRAVRRDDVQGVDLRTAHVVGAIGGRSRERVRLGADRRHEQKESAQTACEESPRGYSHSIVAGGFDETS